MICLLDEEQRNFMVETNQLELLKDWEEQQQKVNRIYEHLKAGKTTFARPERKQEGFVHPDSRKKSQYQFTYFDELGPIGHTNKNDLNSLARNILSYGFSPIEKKDLIILI